MESHDTENLVARYAGLEQRIHAAIRARSATYCANCKTPCCKDEHCCDVADSPWLRRVAELADARTIDEFTQEGPARFLGANGCRLPAGRPMQCTWYICDDLCLAISDPLDRFVYQVISNLLGHVVRKITRNCDLVDIDDLECLTPAQRRKIATRLTEAERCLDIVLTIQSERKLNKPVDETASALLYVCRTLPFAAGTARFEGELPALSAAGRATHSSNSHYGHAPCDLVSQGAWP